MIHLYDDAQFYAVVRVKDGALWQGRLQSHLGMTLSQRMSQHLEIAEGDILALSAGDTTQAVSLQTCFFCRISLNRHNKRYFLH